ncbi:MAG: MFS transporter [Pseudomonadota bacterium]
MSSSGSVAAPSPAGSAWAPFRYRAFALLWTATLISNVGTWMHDVGAGWLMTTLNSSPAVVSLVQAATTLPVFLFALYAGTLADRLDKRKMLITVNVVLLVLIAVLTLLVHLDLVTPVLLILFTLAIGTGTAFMAPAWQAIVPALVPREALQPAIALNSMGINISRAIGPALAGVLIASVSLSAPFAVNAASHIVIIAALLLW